ncbi:hypothetical protein ACFX14_026048 [Malus domestica]
MDLRFLLKLLLGFLSGHSVLRTACSHRRKTGVHILLPELQFRGECRKKNECKNLNSELSDNENGQKSVETIEPALIYGFCKPSAIFASGHLIHNPNQEATEEETEG